MPPTDNLGKKKRLPLCGCGQEMLLNEDDNKPFTPLWEHFWATSALSSSGEILLVPAAL